MGYTRTILQTDGENPIIALAKALVKDRSRDAKDILTQISIRQSPTGSHAPNGLAEAAVKNVEGLVRTMTAELCEIFKCSINATHPILGWIIRHAAYCHNRFAVKASGRTASEELKMVRLTSPMLQLGDSVMARQSGVPDNRLTSSGTSGLWLGRSLETNEHIIGTAIGIVKARTVKQKPAENRWNKFEFDSMVYPRGRSMS